MASGPRPSAYAQDSIPLPSLGFLGFHAGAGLAEVAQRTLELSGATLHCDRARRDRSVQECRADLVDPASGRPIELWLSAMDSLVGILTLAGPVTSLQLTDWKSSLERDYGQVGAEVKGPQWMMQWVRQGRMIRLTWRVEGGRKMASVSLVDGAVLDDWGRRKRSAP